MEGGLLVYEFFAGVYYTVAAWVQKVGFKRRLGKGLGREVSDQDLLSISTWMKIPEEEKSDPVSNPHVRSTFGSGPSRSRF